MLLSIIVPVYNVKDYLIRCLESIHAQTFQDYEVIVVDDGSTDGSGELVDSFCADKERFRVYHQENGGVMKAWKRGVTLAQGEYIGAVDSDDAIANNMYSVLSQRALGSSADIVMCNHYYVSENTGKKELHRNPIREGVYSGKRLDDIRRYMLPLLGEDYISPSRVTKLIRKSLLDACFEYSDDRISSADDVNVIVPCLLKCNSLDYVDEPLYYYIKRANSLSHAFRKYYLDTYEILIEKLNQCLDDCGFDLSEERKGLYNVYGITWANYVYESNLSGKEKRAQLLRVTKAPQYRAAARGISRAQGTIAMIYKWTVQSRCAALYFWGKRLQELIIK